MSYYCEDCKDAICSDCGMFGRVILYLLSIALIQLSTFLESIKRTRIRSWMNLRSSITKLSCSAETVSSSSRRCKDCFYRWVKRKILLRSTLLHWFKDWTRSIRRKKRRWRLSTIKTCRRLNSWRVSERMSVSSWSARQKKSLSLRVRSLLAI